MQEFNPLELSKLLVPRRDSIINNSARLLIAAESILIHATSDINKKLIDRIYKTQGFYYNASDLVKEIPRTMKKFIL